MLSFWFWLSLLQKNAFLKHPKREPVQHKKDSCKKEPKTKDLRGKVTHEMPRTKSKHIQELN